MYFDLVNGNYEENPDGILPGIVGIDPAGNDYRAIMFMPILSELQYGQQIQYLYHVQIKALETENWLTMRTETVTISNSNYINTSTGADAPIEEATTVDDNGNIVINEGYVGQLDYFVDSVGKGMYERIAVYDYILQQIVSLESAKAPKVKYQSGKQKVYGNGKDKSES